MNMVDVHRAWAAEWHSRNRLDGDQRYLMGVPFPPYIRLFKTRRECREWIIANFSDIRTRPDLRAEPHGWYMPQAVRVNVRITKVNRRRNG